MSQSLRPSRRARRTVLTSAALALVAALAALGGPPAAHAADTCPNTAIRSQQHAEALPDCRAYEMVSPPDKNGYDARRTAGTSRVSTDGDVFTYLGVGSFVGEQVGAPIVPRYLAKRTANGWVNRSIDPPQTPSPLSELFCFICDLQDPLGFSADLSESTTRSFARPLAGEPREDIIRLYRRDLVNDAYELLTGLAPGETPAFGSGAYVMAVTPSQDHILFETSENLTADATGTTSKTYEWHDGAVHLVGILPDGTPAPGGAAAADGTGDNYSFPTRRTDDALSRDGRRIVFTALPNNTDGRLFLREDGGTPQARTVWVSQSERSGGSGTPQPATFRGATPDGRVVLFTTAEQLVDGDTNARDDLYRFDLDAPAGSRLTLVTDADAAVTRPVGVVGISRDGERIYYATASYDLILWDHGARRQVATLSMQFLAGAVNDGDNWYRDYASLNPARLSPSGRHLLFVSRSVLTSFDSTSPACKGMHCTEFYLFDADAPDPAAAIACVTCPAPGTTSAGDVDIAGVEGLITTVDRYLPRTIVEHGDQVRVYVTTPEPLDPGDGNGRLDVYQYDSATRTRSLLTSGRSGFDSYFLEASESGDDLFVATREPLTRRDQDTSQDIYDVRAEGGFVEPVAAPDCRGEACRRAPAERANPAAPGSSAVRGPGNVRAAVPVRFRVSPLSRAQVTRLARGGHITLRVTVSRAGRVTTVARARVGRSARVVARVSRRAARAGTVAIPLGLSHAARRQLAGDHRLTVMVTTRFAGTAAAHSTTLRLRTGR